MRGVTLTDITRAADQLLAEGERPTIDGVRRILGTGSPGTVNALLKQYFQSLPLRLNLPASIATAAAELYEQVQSTARQELESERAEAEAALAQGREALAQERRDFEVERTAFHQRVADLNADLERHREQLKTTSAKLASTEKELGTQTTRATTAEAQARASEAERERAAQKHTGELQRLRDQAEGNERHLLGRIDEQKAQLQRLVQDRERETAAAAKHAATLETSVSEAAKLNASLRAELTTAQRDLAKRQEAVVAAENALQRVHEQAARDQALRQAELDRARAEIEQLTGSSEQHKRDRDEALRDAAKLEGRLSALLGQLEEAKAEIRRLQKAKAGEAGSS
jgi:chromosome segregation ATPase